MYYHPPLFLNNILNHKNPPNKCLLPLFIFYSAQNFNVTNNQAHSALLRTCTKNCTQCRHFYLLHFLPHSWHNHRQDDNVTIADNFLDGSPLVFWRSGYKRCNRNKVIKLLLRAEKRCKCNSHFLLLKDVNWNIFKISGIFPSKFHSVKTITHSNILGKFCIGQMKDVFVTRY